MIQVGDAVGNNVAYNMLGHNGKKKPVVFHYETSHLVSILPAAETIPRPICNMMRYAQSNQPYHIPSLLPPIPAIHLGIYKQIIKEAMQLKQKGIVTLMLST
jgi:hypothetical protein